MKSSLPNIFSSRYIKGVLISLGIVLTVSLVSVAGMREIRDQEDKARQAEQRGDIPTALTHYAVVLNRYDADANPEEQKAVAAILKHAGDLCYVRQRFIEAMEFYITGYQAASRGGNSDMMIRCLGNIGNIHSIFEDYERADTYYNKGYELALRYKSNVDQYKFLLSLALNYAAQNKTREATEALRKMQMIPNTGLSSAMMNFHTFYVQGAIAQKSRNNGMARHFYREALQTAIVNNIDTLNIANQIWEIGNTYKKEQPDSAMAYYNRALELCQKAGVREIQPKIYASLSDVFAQKGNAEESRKYLTLSRNLSDSLYNTRDYLRSRSKLEEYEDMVKTTKISDLSAKLTVHWAILGCILVVLTVVTVFTILIIRRNRALKVAYSALVDRNQELIKSEEINKQMTEKYLDKLTPLQASEASEAAEQPSPQPAPSASDDAADSSAAEAEQASQNTYLNEETIQLLRSRINRVMADGEHIFNPDFNLNMLASLVKSNMKYVSWVINETYGKNFKSFLNEHRIREACRRLSDRESYGNLTIQAVAEDVGYRSSTSFIQAFKRIVGMTPSVYQKLALEKAESQEDESGDDN